MANVQEFITPTITFIFALAMFMGFVGGFKSGINAS